MTTLPAHMPICREHVFLKWGCGGIGCSILWDPAPMDKLCSSPAHALLGMFSLLVGSPQYGFHPFHGVIGLFSQSHCDPLKQDA